MLDVTRCIRCYSNFETITFLIVEQIFREANVSLNGHINYEDFVKIACAPVPDYY